MATWQTRVSAAEADADKRRRLFFGVAQPSALSLNGFLNQAVEKADGGNTKGKGKGKGEKGTPGTKGKGKGSKGKGTPASGGAGATWEGVIKAHGGTKGGDNTGPPQPGPTAWECAVCGTAHANPACQNCRSCGCKWGTTKAQAATLAKEYKKAAAEPEAKPPGPSNGQPAQPPALGRAAKAEAVNMAILADIESRPLLGAEPPPNEVVMVDLNETPVKGSSAHYESLLKSFLDSGAEDEAIQAAYALSIKKAKDLEAKEAKASSKPLCHLRAAVALSTLESKSNNKHLTSMTRLRQEQEETATQLAELLKKQAANAACIKEELDSFELHTARIAAARARLPLLAKAKPEEEVPTEGPDTKTPQPTAVLSVDTLCASIQARMESTIATEAGGNPALQAGLRAMLSGLANDLIAQSTLANLTPAAPPTGELVEIPDDTSELIFPWSPAPEEEDDSNI